MTTPNMDERNAGRMSGAQMVIEALRDNGVDTIFGYPGGAVLPIYDEIHQQSDIRHILVRHEQGAGHMAEGYARSTGRPGVVLVTSGPGATNMVTALTDAMMDSIPLVCLTGQVPTHLIGNDAFQECDTVGITRPCTKHNWLVRRVEDLPRILHEAFYVATTGRPGPVVVDIPKDVQIATGLYVPPAGVKHKTYRPQTKPEMEGIRQAVALMKAASRRSSTPAAPINAGPRRRSHPARARRPHGLPRDLDAEWGLGAAAGQPPASGFACSHARHLRGEHCHARVRSIHDLHQAPARRTASPAPSSLLAGSRREIHIDI